MAVRFVNACEKSAKYYEMARIERENNNEELAVEYEEIAELYANAEKN